jgi:hypothetical protein
MALQACHSNSNRSGVRRLVRMASRTRTTIGGVLSQLLLLKTGLCNFRFNQGLIERGATEYKFPRELRLQSGPNTCGLGFDPWESWVGLGPDDTPLLMRDKSTQEIYRLDLDLP